MNTRAIVRQALVILKDSLPSGWAASPPRLGEPSPCAGTMDLSGPERRSFQLELIVQETVDLRTANTVMACLQPGELRQTTILVAQGITPAAREILRKGFLSHFDTLGNVWLKIGRPGLSFEKEGKPLLPTRKEQALCSLKGKQAGKVVRRLIASARPPAVRRLSEELEVDAGYVSRILTFLESLDLIVRKGHGRVESVDWERILRKWASDAPLRQRGKVYPGRTHDGVLKLVEDLHREGATPLLTGKDAATRMIAISHFPRQEEPLIPKGLPPISVTSGLDDEQTGQTIDASSGPGLGRYWPSSGIYLKGAGDAINRLGISALGDPPDIYVIEGFDDDVFHGAVQIEGRWCAAPYQIAADLLSRPEQASSAEALIDWMRDNKNLWRE